MLSLVLNIANASKHHHITPVLKSQIPKRMENKVLSLTYGALENLNKQRQTDRQTGLESSSDFY